MALFDLYQLADPYNLRRSDAEFLSNHSHPPPMSPTTQTQPRQTRSKVHLSLPLPVLPPPKTSRQRRDPATVVGLTPISRCKSIRQKQDGDTDRVDKYDREDYEECVWEDLSCRVFVDNEVFMKYVLHLPTDWRTKWAPVIDAVNTNANFEGHHEACRGLCDEKGTVEKDFYQPLVKTANAVLEVISRSKSLHWANPLHVLEVNSYGNAICDGGDMPKLVVDGKSSAKSFRAWL